MLRTVTLYGGLRELAQKDTIELEADTPVSLLLGLRSQIPGFRQFCSEQNIALIAANDTKATNIVANEFNLPFGDANNIHILPEADGAGFDPVSWIALISFSLEVSTLMATVIYVAANIAIAVAVSSIISSLAPSPDMSAGSGKESENPSFMYNGAVNVVEQGYPVPLVYGKHMAGSIVVSAGVTVEEIPYVPEQEEEPDGPVFKVNPDNEAWQRRRNIS